MNDYKSVYKNTGTTPRTIGEAYHTPDYAYPIQRFKSEYDDAKEFVIGFVQVSVVIALLGLIAYSLYSLFVI